MIPISGLLASLAERGISVSLAGDQLRVRGRTGTIDPAIRAELSARKAELVQYLSEARAPEAIRLSDSQRRLWFLDKLSLMGHEYTLMAAWQLTSGQDPERLARSLDAAVSALVRRHPILGQTVDDADGEPVLVSLPPGRVALEQVTAPDVADEAAILAAEMALPFRIVGGPLFRVRLIVGHEMPPLMVLAVHHIISDHASMGIIVRDLSALLSGKAVTASGTGSVQPAALPADEASDVSLAFWKDHLHAAPAEIALPFDRPRPARRSSLGATLSFDIPAAADLGQRARDRGLTPFMAYLAVFARVLGLLSGQTDLIIGCPVSRRDHPDLLDRIGFLVNTLALRFDLTDQDDDRLLQQVRRTVVSALEHKGVAFETLVSQLRPQRHLDRNPLFQAMFVLQSAPVPPLVWPEAAPVAAPVPPMAPEVDLSLQILPGAGDAPSTGYLEYDPALFDRETAAHIAALFVAACEDLDRTDKAATRRLPASRLEGARRPLPAARLGSLLQAALAADPDRLAVVPATGEGVTAGALLEMALALVEADLSTSRRELVRIAVEAGVPLVAAVLGCLIAGRPFLILPPSLEDAGRLDQCRQLGAGRAIRFDSSRSALYLDGAADPARPEPCEGLAYVCLTSGSTGVAKAVHVPEIALRNHAVSIRDTFGLTQGDRVLAFAAPVFDVALEEIVPSLLAGACLVFMPSCDSSDPAAFTASLARRRISVVNLPAPFWHAWTEWLVADGRVLPPTLRLVVTGSDRVRTDAWAVWQQRFRDTRLLAGYGPTETTITATFHPAEATAPDGLASVPLGHPVHNTDVTLRDASGAILPVACVGEIVIEGMAVASGYGPGAEASAFMRLDEGQVPAFRTGDLGRLRRDGTLEFLGRRDALVKIRGVRLHPMTVEAALESHPEVTAAAVLVHAASGPSPALVGIYEGTAATADLAQWMRRKVGPAATPSRWLRLPALPRLASGKLDRRSLAEMPVAPEAATKPDLPRDAREARIAEAFAAVLGLTVVDRQAGFFDLGGDSLASLRIVAEAARRGLRLTAETIFRHQTVAAIAAAAEALHIDEAETAEATLPLTPILAFFHRTTGPAWRQFNQAVMVILPDGIEADRLREALHALVARHAALRMTVDLSGPEPVHRIAERAAAPHWRVFDPGTMGRDEVIAEAHRCLDPEQGRNVAAVLFAEERRLLLVIHHLSVDVLSWPVLLDDLAQLHADPSAAAQVPGTSFAGWARRLNALLREEDALPGVDFWMARLGGSVRPLLPQITQEPGLESDVATLRIALDAGATRDLLSAGPATFGLSVDELLILAIVREAGGRGAAPLRIDLERNGRGLGVEGVDISRTVGWFTSLLPLRLPAAASTESQARLIRTAIDDQPLAGLGYGLARELSPAAPILATLPAADLLVNYIGAPRGWTQAPWQPDDAPTGPAIAPEVRRTHLLELNAGVIGGELRLEVNFPDREGARAAVAGWLDALSATLTDLATTARHQQFGGALPQDCVDILPVTPAQAGIYWHSLRNAATYHDQLLFSLAGPLDPGRLQLALDQLVASHEALRCVFRPDANDRLHQLVLSRLPADWRTVDLGSRSPGEAEQDLAALRAADAASPFDPGSGPLQRFHLVKMPGSDWRLLWSCHHLVTDGWSVSILLEEWLERYAALCEDREPRLSSAAPLAEVLRARAAQPGGNDWIRDLLRDADIPRLSDATSGTVGAGPAGPLTHDLDPQVQGALVALAQDMGTTWAVVFQAAWALTLGRLLQAETVVFGLTAAGRPLQVAGADRTIGMFVNTLPVRAQVDDLGTARQVIEALHLQARVREGFAGADLAGALQESPETAGVPFDTLLLVQNYPRPRRLEAAGVTVRLDLVSETSEFAATVLAELGAQPRLTLLHDASRVSSVAAEGLLATLTHALRWMATTPDAPLRNFAPPAPPRPAGAVTLPGRPFPEQVEDWARLLPKAVAVTDATRSLTYGELQAESLKVAHHLASAGIRRGDRVLLALPPSVEFIIAFLGTMRAGAVVCSLDLGYPSAAKSYQIEDYRPQAIITDQGRPEPLLDALDVPRLTRPLGDPSAPQAERITCGAEDAAYLIYTSGSTGKPKGSFCAHRGLASLAGRQREIFRLTPGDRVLQAASLAFDASIWEITMALGAGATLHIPPVDSGRAGRDLADVLVDRAITAATLPPSVLATLPPGAYARLRTLIVAGEACPPDLALRWGHGRRFFNAYGPSETGICATIHEGSGDGRQIPIGKAIDGVTAHVTDHALRPLPDGFAGELVIGGLGVGLGYWNRPDLTAERFPADVLGDSPGGRLYRSGDRARRGPDGVLQFLGRIDRQIKLRGFRIEPGEIEAYLLSVAGVERALVGARRLQDGHHALLAWLVARSDLDLAALKERMRHDLPPQLVPHHLVRIADVPLTPSGKTDWAALPLPDLIDRQPAPDAGEKADDRAPQERTYLSLVTGHWGRILVSGDAGPDDNFFDAGGDSLLLVRLLGLLADATGVRLSPAQVIRNPTPRGIAAQIAARMPQTDAEPGETAVRAEPSPPAQPALLRQTQETVQGAPVAIIGMAARYPGAPDLAGFRRLLFGGTEGLSRLGRDRMLAAGARAADIDDPAWVPVAGLLDDAEAFDHELFGISRREATLLDPQHRVFLECAWSALEDGGYPGRGAPLDCGVFAGCGMNRWVQDILAPSGEDTRGAAGFHLATGNEKDFLVLQTAYRLNLTGPAMTVQTACSTSLVAVASAVSALRAGACDMALAGGVSIPMPQGRGYRYEPDMILSPDGHCRPFLADAAGTVPSAGAGIVLLKRLDRALADGDAIHAVIRGVGLSNDGAAKMAFSAPGVDGQAAAIRRALADAGLARDDIDYIEAHGTGTTLGDPVEVLALSRILGGRRSPLLLGSVKSMIGHCDAAAGVAGLIKTVLALQEARLPASLHLGHPNPRIDFTAGPFEVVAEARAWPAVGRARRAGVSSFGIGGTNAHVILEAATPAENAVADAPPAALPILLTGHSDEALRRRQDDIRAALEAAPPAEWPRMAATLQARAGGLPLRRAFVLAPQSGRLAPVSAAPRRAGSRPKLAFLLPGQGSQSPGMAAQLYRDDPTFREHLDRFSRYLAPHLGAAIPDLLYGPGRLAAKPLSDTERTQPIILAVSVSAARMWQARGVVPDALLGHSVGEIGAAHLAGILDEPSAAALIAARARIVASQPRGAMLALALPPESCEPFLRDGLCLAAVNGAAQCVLSGPEPAVEALERWLLDQRQPFRRLQTSHAFHSSMLAAAASDLVQEIRSIGLSAPALPIISSMTGRRISASEAQNPEFWGRQLTETVRFSTALASLKEMGITTALDVGPGRIMADLAGGAGLDAVVGMGAGAGDGVDDARARAALWERAVPLRAATRVVRPPARLPAYPFARIRCAPDAPAPARQRDSAVRYYAPVLEPVPDAEPAATPGGIVLVGPEPACLGRAAQALERMNADLRAVAPCPAGRDDLAALCQQWNAVFDSLAEPAATIMMIEPAQVSASTMLNEAMAATLRLVALVQVVTRRQAGRPCRLVHLTLSCRENAPELAAAASAAEIARAEHPELDLRIIDVGPGSELDQGLRLGLSAAPTRGTLLLRQGRSYRRTVQEVTPPPASAWPGLRSGSLLITGGFGHLGASLATALSRQADVTPVLLGRTLREEVRKSLSAQGVEPICEAIDVADADALGHLVHRLAREGRPVRGVIHAAGMADWGGVIHRRTDSDLRDVWAGKVGGLLALEAALQGTDLDMMLLCSTLGSFLPNAKFGQVAYAAANAYLDAAGALLAQRHGWPARVVNWDDFTEGGMSVAAALRRGLPPPPEGSGLTNAQARAAVGRIMAAPHPRLAVTVHDLPGLIGRIENAAASVGETPAAEVHEPAPSVQPARIVTTSTEGLEAFLIDVFGQVLGDPGVHAETDFFQAGGHSLLAMQVVSRIREQDESPVGVTDLFDAPTPRDLAARLMQRRTAQ